MKDNIRPNWRENLDQIVMKLVKIKNEERSPDPATEAVVLLLLDELEGLGIADNTIIIYTSDHGELCGAHGLSGKGATAFREQNHVPFIISHPEYRGSQRCKAVTSHVDIAPTLVSIAGGKTSEEKGVCGKDITPLLENPEAAALDELRPGALYNFNMLGFVDGTAPPIPV